MQSRRWVQIFGVACIAVEHKTEENDTSGGNGIGTAVLIGGSHHSRSGNVEEAKR